MVKRVDGGRPRSRTRIAVMALVLLPLTSAVVIGNASATPLGSLAVDASVSKHQASASRFISSPAFSTRRAGELVLAFVASAGPAAAGAQSITGVSGGGLTWSLRARSNAQPGAAEIWQAVAGSSLDGVVVTATRASSSTGSLTVVSFSGADTTTSAAVSTTSGDGGAPSAAVTTTRNNSWVWGTGSDLDRAVPRSLPTGQRMTDQFVAGSVGDTYWTQHTAKPAAAAGTTAVVRDTAPSTDRWNLAAVEIVPSVSGVDSTAPAVAVADPAKGATVSGEYAVRATASDDVGVAGVQFFVDGAPVGSADTTIPYSRRWDTLAVRNGVHTVSAVARDAAGNTARTADVTVTVANAGGGTAPTLDPSTPGPTAVARNAPSTSSPSFSPPGASVLYAVFSMDSASYNGSVTTVASVSNSGTPLAWHLIGRENSHNSAVGGFVEVWWAYNASAQSGISATGTFSQNTKNVTAPVGDFQVLVLDHAAADQSTAAWTSNAVIDRRDTEPTVTVTTSAANSRVFAVFDDWDTAVAPTPGAGQSVQSIVLNAADVDGYWVLQRIAAVPSPASVRLYATLSATTQWHAIAWEVLPAA